MYLVRHGRTDSNVRGLLHGVTDVPLDAHGVRQAQAVADRLAREIEAEVLLSSSLQRALVTARIIGKRVGLEPEIVPDLGEINFGELEGVSFEGFMEDHAPLAASMLDDRAGDIAWPGGESRRVFDARVHEAFLAILRRYAAHRVIVVAHGGVIGTFLARILGLSPNAPDVFDIMNCSLSHLDVGPDFTLLHARNDVVHLEVLGDPTGDVEVRR